MAVGRALAGALSYWVLHEQPRVPDEMEGKELSEG